MGSVTKTKHQKDYRANNIGFIRLIAALMVVYSHLNIYAGDVIFPHTYIVIDANNTFGLGTLGVSIFFMLSGYLITQSWFRSKSAGSFLIKRVARIYPAFIVNFMFCLFLFTGLAAPDYWFHIFSVLSNPATLAGDLLFFSDTSIPNVYAGNPYAHGGVNNPLWTLPYEFIMYMSTLAAGLIVLCVKKRAVALIVPFWILVMLNAKAINLHAVTMMIDGDKVFMGDAVFVIVCYCIGVFYYFLTSRIVLKKTAAFLCGAGILLVFAGNCFHWWPYQISVAAHYLLFPYFLFYWAFKSNWGILNFERFGDYSYGVYLYHWPVMQTLIVFAVPLFVFVPAALLITAIFAFLSWHGIEKRALKAAKKCFAVKTARDL